MHARKSFVFIGFFFFGLNLFAQLRIDTTYYAEYGLGKKIHKIIVTKGNSSKHTVYNEQGTIQEKYNLVDEKKEGEYISYFRNGKIEKSIQFHKGKKEGKELDYFLNANIKSLTHYKGNYLLGEYKIWSEPGVLIQNGKYDTLRNKQGKIESVFDGKWESYYYSGKKEKECHYVKGKLDGLCKEWYANGVLKSSINYKEGVVYGKEEYWYENGNKRKEGLVFYDAAVSSGYAMPKYEGKQIQYFENGTISSVQSYLNFIPHGAWLRYSGQGILLEEKNYEHGQLVMPNKVYHSNGKLYQNFPYKKFTVDGRDTSLLDGLMQQFYANGNTMQELNYVKGLPYGLNTLFFENGKVERQLRHFGALDRYAILKEYDASGTLRKEGTSEVNANDSMSFKKLIYAAYAANGLLSYKLNYKSINGIGSYEARYENGNLLAEAYIFSKRDADYISVFDLGSAWQAIYYPNGALRYEFLTLDNFKHGQYIEWFADGNLKRFMDPSGLDIQWLQNGELMLAQVYNTHNNLVRDTLLPYEVVSQLYASLTSTKSKQIHVLNRNDGIQRSYYGDGKIKYETWVKNGFFEKYFLAFTFSGDTLVYMELKDGILHGRYLVKNGDGSFFNIGMFEEGEPVANWKLYNRKGLPQRFFGYDKGVKGYKPYTYEHTFFENGSIESKGNYVLGKKNNWFVTYHPNGKVNDSSFFKMDTLWGLSVSYTDEGKPFSETHYDKGLRQGWHKQWYYKEGSRLMRQEWYEANERHGEARYYHKNGKLNLVAFFKQGKEDSLWVYYDTVGNIQRTEMYKDGLKIIEPLVGKCACRDKEMSKEFAQSLSSLLNDETDISLWQFHFHESVVPMFDQTYFRNLQTSTSRNATYYNFDLLSFKPIKIGLPSSSGIKLWLNPCWQQGEESVIDIGVNITQRQPDLTQLIIGSDRMAFILPPRIFKPKRANSSDVVAYFSTEYIQYNKDGINFNNAKALCVDDAYLLHENYGISLSSFTVLNLDIEASNNWQRMAFFSDDKLANDIKKGLGSDPILINEGSGDLQINFNNQVFEAKVMHMLISAKVVAGYIVMEDVEVLDGKLVKKVNGDQVEIVEKDLYEQMMVNGFTKVLGQYNPEKKALEILFYIKKP